MTKSVPTKRAEAQQTQETETTEAAPGAVVRDTPAVASGSIAPGAPATEAAQRSDSPEVVEVDDDVIIRRRASRPASSGEALPAVPRKAPGLRRVLAAPGFGDVAVSEPRQPFVAPGSTVPGPSGGAQPQAATVKADVSAGEGWTVEMRRTQGEETRRRDSYHQAGMASLARPDPPYVLGRPNLHGAPLVGEFSHTWAMFPRDRSTFSFSDMTYMSRSDVDVVNTGTDCDSTWAHEARARFMGHLEGCYQVPPHLYSDRAFVRDSLDAVYLEGMEAYLLGKSDVAPITDLRFWRFHLPKPTRQGERGEYDRYRTEWSLCRGFERVITFEVYDTLRRDDSAGAQYDVCTGSLEKRTELRVSLDHFPRLSEVIRKAKGPPGLCIRMPRILRLFGDEVAQPSQFSEYTDRLTWACKVEYVHALACGLHLDFVVAQMVWVVSSDCLALLTTYSCFPGMGVHTRGVDATEFKVTDLITRLRAVRTLGREYLFERTDFPSQEKSRWAVLGPDGYVVAARYAGGYHGGKPVVRPPRARQGSGQGYFGGFAPRIDPHASKRMGSLETCVVDADVRGTVDVGPLLRPYPFRDSGWTVRELVALAMGKLHEAEARIQTLERELEDARFRVRQITGSAGQGYEYVYRGAPAPQAPQGSQAPAVAPRDHGFSDPYLRESGHQTLGYPAQGYGQSYGQDYGQASGYGGHESKRARHESSGQYHEGQGSGQGSGEQYRRGSGASQDRQPSYY